MDHQHFTDHSIQEKVKEMKSSNPLMIAVIKCYCSHRGYFYLNNFQSFKLFASWLLDQEIGDEYVGTPLPWYRSSYELQQLAKILKCSEQELLGTIEEVYDDY